MMSSSREIVTLQLGTFSNFIGAHWWNIQESGFSYDSDNPSEINHDVLYREGLTNSGHVTYTPRLIAVDLKGTLNHLPRRGELYDKPSVPDQTDPLWPGDKVEVIQEPSSEKNEFLQLLDATPTCGGDASLENVKCLEEQVNSWSDFLVTRYHPNTVHIINEYEYNSTSKPFEIFNCGVEVWKDQDFQEDFIDRIRRFVEECDNFQGFHLLMDASDGFSGIGASSLQHLEDEYSSKSVLVFPSIPSSPAATPTADCIRAINTALLFPKLNEHSSLFVPICLGSSGWKQPGAAREFPHLKYNINSPYHTSAILAAALDSTTLSYRMRGNNGTLAELCSCLARVGRTAAAASVGIPFPIPEGATLLSMLEQWEGPLWQSLTPACSLNDDRIWVQSVVLRGISQDKLRSPNHNYHDWNPAYRCTTVQEMISLFLSCCSYATASITHTADVPCKVAPPFPNLFSDNILRDGTVGTTPRTDNSGVVSVPVIAGLHSSRSVGDMLESLHTQVTKLKLKSFHQFRSSGLENDEFLASLESLLDFRECYHEEFNV